MARNSGPAEARQLGIAYVNGLVLVDKPAGCTSHDVVNRWRKLAGTKRVGHLGTLDPMATGLLVLLTGTATRLAQFFEKETKTYEAEITFCAVSDTYDAQGDVTETGVQAPPLEAVERALPSFRGRFLQKPPAISAKKINGVAAYKLARKQIPVHLPPVQVEISTLEVQSYMDGKLHVMMVCSAGTYVRSLAHDLGQQLGCGGILTALRRTRVGQLRVEDAFNLEALQEVAGRGELQRAVHSSSALLPHFPSVYVDATVEKQIRQGRDFRASPFAVPHGARFVKALNEAGELIAIGQIVIPNVYHPATVLF